MSDTKVIKSVGEPELVTFKNGGESWKFPLEFEDGSDGFAWRHPDVKKFPPKVGQKGTVDSNDKFTALKEEGAGSAGGGGTVEFRTPNQIMRGDAAVAASHVSANLDNLKENAQAIFEWIKGDDAPAQAQPSLDDLKKELQQLARDNSVELSDVANAIVELHGRTNLEVGDDLAAIIEKAAQIGNDDVPF